MTGIEMRHETVDDHIQSAGAEMAVAKFLNMRWNASIDDFNNEVPDVGEAIEVRYRRKDYDLLIRDRDPEKRDYVLVRGAMPTYEIIGWIHGWDAKQERFRANSDG